ncbi:MAG: hypothetical protein PHG40_04345 [Candidatus Omnitrophica bacterium]|nr:hypothetical protein [Candidatus Omnitrophota bacterium]
MFFLLFVAVFVFITSVAVTLARKRDKALKELAANLNAKIPKFSFYPTLNGEHQGLKYTISLFPGGKNTPPYLQAQLLKKSAFRLSVYRESILSDFGKKLGLVHEVKVNDPAFDKDFLFFSNRQEQASTYLNNQTVKEAIQGLFRAGFDSLTIDYQRVTVRRPDYSLEQDLSVENVKVLLQRLAALAQGL